MTLKEEIAKPEYATMKDAEIANTLNNKVMTVMIDTSAAAVDQIIVPTGELFEITLAAAVSPPTAITPVAWNFSRMLDRWGTISTSQPSIAAAVGVALEALQTAKLLSEESVRAIIELGVGKATYLSTISATSPLNEADIANARAE